MATRQAPASSMARDVGPLSNGRSPYQAAVSRCLDQTATASQRAGQFYCIGKILGKFTAAKSLLKVVELVCELRKAPITGPGRHQDGLPIRSRVFLPGRTMDERLLVDALRRSLVVQFGEKLLFIKQYAGSQQFQKRIVGFSRSAARLVPVARLGDQRARRGFQLWFLTRPASKEINELPHTLALLFCASRKFNAHAMSGMHDADHAVGMDLHSGGAQAKIDN